MELLLNELSLSGQFTSVDEFVEKALPRIFEVFKSLNAEDEIYKTYNFYDCKVTSKESIHNVLTGQPAKMYDEIRRFKIYLSNLFENPYWQDSPKHSLDISYKYGEKIVTNTSIAESSERDRMLISFINSEYQDGELQINKEGEKEEIVVYNLTESGQYLKVSWTQGKITLGQYCERNYNNKSKLNFSQIDSRNGFNLLTSQEDIELFEAAFKKFVELTWQQISIDDGLDYKQYNNKDFYKDIKVKKHKFRVSQKYRCFGYVENSVFYVLCFDLTHKLSD